jgi:A/G-specific adenine glycosylase
MFKKLIDWSKDQYSHLPWRKERSLYRTLVSEIMLQQTTVGTVLNHFEKFIKTYPDLKSLATTNEEKILISWKGLGYYRRARNLRHIAIEIENKFKGKVPTNEDELLSLKGIGQYTAHAIMAMGSDQRALAVDANLERVLARYYGYTEIKGPKLQNKILEDFKAKKILTEMNKLSSRELNEALMDLGRVICQKRKTWCHICVLSNTCVAFKKREPLSYPRENELKKNEKFELELLRVVVREKNKILVYQKKESEWLAGQWELPTFILSSNDENLKQYPQIKTRKSFASARSLNTSITKYKIINRIVEMELTEFKKLTQNVAGKYQYKIYDKKLNLSTASLKALSSATK